VLAAAIQVARRQNGAGTGPGDEPSL